MSATTATDGGSVDDDFEAALEAARSRIAYEHDPEDFADYGDPRDALTGTARAIAWAAFPTWTVLLEAVRSDRLRDEDGAAPVPPRTPRTFLFGRDEDEDPAFVVHGSFLNRYDDDRTVVETPAPWDTPDDMAPGNDVVKSLPWGEDETEEGDDREGAHYTFEEKVRRPGVDAENVWVIDSDYADDLREAATDAGYEWHEADGGRSEDEERLAEVAEFLHEADYDRETYDLVGGDDVFVRYESKQTGDVKEKSGTVVDTYNGPDGPEFAFERVDGKTNRIKADGGEVGIYSTGHYPFMGTVRSIEALPK